MKRLGLALAAALTIGCGTIEGAPSPEIVEPLILTPDAELADETADAVEAWQRSAGVEIVIGSNGVPVRLSDDLDRCGLTTTLRRALDGFLIEIRSVEIRSTAPEGLYCRPRAATLRHELAHVLQQHAEAAHWPTTGDGHVDRGLLAPKANLSHTIDVEALEQVCSVAACAWIEPEAP